MTFKRMLDSPRLVARRYSNTFTQKDRWLGVSLMAMTTENTAFNLGVATSQGDQGAI